MFGTHSEANVEIFEGCVYNAVVYALVKTTTKTNWQKVKATSPAIAHSGQVRI